MMGHPEALELFGRQYGVAATRQLRDLGISQAAISRAIDQRVLLRETTSVVRLAGYPFGFEARAMTACLQCGPRSFLAGSTAAAIHGMRYMSKGRIYVAVLNRCQVSPPPWLRISRTTWMLAGDIVTHPSGMRLMSPLRTLHHLAGILSAERFERAAEDAWHLGLVVPPDAADYLARMRRQGRSGVSGLDAWLERTSVRPRPSQSGLEMDALEAIRRVGLPEPQRQHQVLLRSGEPRHLDLAWPDIRYGVEPGHSWWHGGDLGQRRSQSRQRDFEEVGWQVTYFDESMSADIPGAGRQIRQIYLARRALFDHTSEFLY
jgi:hypothetical protein